jgi:hypothetical protein
MTALSPVATAECFSFISRRKEHIQTITIDKNGAKIELTAMELAKLRELIDEQLGE